MAASFDGGYSSSIMRLGSFKNWAYTDNPSAIQLSKSGLFYKGPGDLVECFACGVQLKDWKNGMDAYDRHKKAGPDCPYINEMLNSPNESPYVSYLSYGSNATSINTLKSVNLGNSASSDGSSSASRDLQSNGAAAMAPDSMAKSGATPSEGTIESVINTRSNQSQAKRKRKPPPEKYKKFDERLASYAGKDWPKHLTVQPENLSKAGFYYAGPGDRVKCGYCGGVLKNWQPKDVAIDEHRRHYGDCEFVKTVEKQTEALAKNIKSKKHGTGMSSQELMKKAREEKLKKESKEGPVRTLVELGYSLALVQKAKIIAQQQNVEPSITKLLPILQDLEKRAYLGEIAVDDEQDSGASPSQKIDGHRRRSSVESLSSDDDEDLYAADSVPVAKAAVADNDFQELLRKESELRKKYEELQNQMTCKICLTNQIDTLFLTCRHFCTCKSCADQVKDCPVCRQLILGTVDVFIA